MRYCPHAGEPLAPSTAISRDPLHSAPGPVSQPDDAGLALQPQVVRRHRQHGVVVEQRGQRLDVVALERVGVLGGQRRLVVRAGRADLRLVDAVLAERGPGPLQRAVHRGDGGAEQLGDLLRLPPQHLAQDEHRPLLRREVLQGADERQPDRLLGRGDLARVTLGDDATVGDRLDPRRLAACRERGPLGDLRLAEVHRPGPPLLAAQHVQADVRCDAIQPGPQRGAALERVVGLPRPDHRLLHGVLGFEARSEHAVAVGDQLAAVLLELAFERQRRRVGGGWRRHRSCDHGRPRQRRLRAACRGSCFTESRGRGRWTVDEACCGTRLIASWPLLSRRT